MNDDTLEKIINVCLWLMMFGFLSYSLYAVGNSRSFDNQCAAACAPSRSITPIIDLTSRCLCDEGHGRWRFQEVKSD
jgi:hypothetical protein